jgi:hypothetical protein
MLGELVTYVFKSGESRIVRAVVNRIGLAGVRRRTCRRSRSCAPPSRSRGTATVGIVTFTPGDRLVLAMRLGEAPVTVRAKEIIAQDEGMPRPGGRSVNDKPPFDYGTKLPDGQYQRHPELPPQARQRFRAPGADAGTGTSACARGFNTRPAVGAGGARPRRHGLPRL